MVISLIKYNLLLGPSLNDLIQGTLASNFLIITQSSIQTHQSVSLPPDITGHRHRYGSREVFSRWSTARSAAHRELRAGQAEVQNISSCPCLDGCGWTASCMHLKLMNIEEDSVIKTDKCTKTRYNNGWCWILSGFPKLCDQWISMFFPISRHYQTSI